MSRVTSRRGTKVAFLAIVATIIMALPVTSGEAPWIDLVSPEDGGWVTEADLLVTGNATPPAVLTELGGEFLSDGTGFGFTMEGTSLRVSPRALFSDDFSGTDLDTDKWEVLRYYDGISFANGHMKLVNQGWSFPLVRSAGASFPVDADWQARFQMQMVTNGYSGSGGGIADYATDAPGSHMAAYNLWEGWNVDRFKVYSDGEVVASAGSDATDHEYALSYDAGGNRFTTLMDGEVLDTFVSSDMPDQFWFGSTTQGLYQFYSHLDIDYADVWAFNGVRTFPVIEFPHTTVVDRVTANWTTNRPDNAEVEFEARMSADNQSWSMWLPMLDGVSPETLEGRYLQLRLIAGFGVLRDTEANIAVNGVTLERHHPVTLVEARNVDTDGEWTNASGTETWSAGLLLREGWNTIEVRVTDTAGQWNVTSLEQLLDTIPPVGTVRILKDREYTNNLNVTLSLEGTDLHGVEYVSISNARDMSGAITFPYTETIDWTMAGDDGVVTCFVRFIDAHGLVSETVSDTIMYDSIAPSGEVSILQGREFTPSLTVDLDLVYSDTRGVSTVELSNAANFTDIRTVTMGEDTFSNWTLAEGGDGPRTVYMRMTDLAGNSRVVSDSIEFYSPKVIGGMTIEGGAEITRNPAVVIEVDVPLKEGPRTMQLSNDAAFMDSLWEPVDDTVTWILSPGDGPKVVYLRFMDYREVVSLPICASIVLDTTDPLVAVLLDGGAEYTSREEVLVTLEYADATPAVAMWVSRVDRFNEADEEPFAEAFTWTVPPREGAHDIYVRVMDMAGNEVVVHSSIWFASILPKVTVTLVDGDVVGDVDHLTVTVSTEDRYGGLEYVLAIDADPLEEGLWQVEEGPFYVPVPGEATDGAHMLTVRGRNVAGLVSDPVIVNFTLDLTPPDAAIVSPLDGDVLAQSGLEVLLQLTAHDPAGISMLRYRLDDGGWETVPGGGLTAVVVLEGFGDHTIEAEVTDGVGNSGTVSTSFRVEDSETRVGSGGSWVPWLVLVVVLAVMAIALEVHMRRSGGSLVGAIARRPQTGTEKGSPAPRTPDPTGPPADAGAPPGPEEASRGPGEGSLEGPQEGLVDEDGVEWEMA